MATRTTNLRDNDTSWQARLDLIDGAKHCIVLSNYTIGADERIADPAVKERLRLNTEEAVARGVFGVPTALVDDELFWGADATEMLLDYLAADAVFNSQEMGRASNLPAGVVRRRT